jgi:solute carrier family 12 (sodium/potassium/chloride transporter), member 2
VSKSPGQPKLFGTFTGVFTPTLLTILGVIMYIRVGWVVGNAGLLGAWLVMLLALGITACTGLSLSSIATNTRLGAGGPYAIMSKSLGLEAGGSIGIPLYLSRPLGVAMYIIGFREGWLWLFENHNPLAVDLAVFALVFGIAYASADLAFRIQYAIMAVIALSLFSIFMSPLTFEPANPVSLWGEFVGFPERGFEKTIDFWVVFAVFFPATTGILAGANMSGELRDPRRAIPIGTLSAIVLSSVIYFLLAWWAARAGTMEELTTNYNLIIDKARWPMLVLFGLLGATFSSALAGIVGGPRILMAMAEHRILPASDWLAAKAPNGEPRNAMVFTGVLTLACIMVRDLNAIAPLVTMFFLITYAVLNLVVLVETGLGLVSFRPTLRIPWVIPLMGLGGSIFAMFIVAPTFGLIAVVLVLAIYVWIERSGVQGDGDVRSSMFVALAEWAAIRTQRMAQGGNNRAWKPSLMVPLEDPEEIAGEFQFLLDCTRPEGSVKLLGLATLETVEELRPRVARLGSSFGKADVFCTWSIVDSTDYAHGAAAGLQALQSAFFRPNVLYLTVPSDPARYQETTQLIEQATRTGCGVMLFAHHRRAGLGQRGAVNIWLRPPEQWSAANAFRAGNPNLALLMGYRLSRTWNGELNLITAVDDAEDVPNAQRFLRELADLTRLPPSSGLRVLIGPMAEVVDRAPAADLHILGLQNEPDFAFAEDMVERTRSSCLLVADSGRESALA